MKLVAAIFTAVLVTFGASTADAAPPTPEDCVEADDIPEGVDCSGVGENFPLEDEYPLLLPEEGTVPDSTTPPTTEPTGALPATGSDGTSGLLQVGGLLLAGGVIVVIIARRRQPAAAA